MPTSRQSTASSRIPPSSKSAGALLRAVWEQQRDIADAATLTAILGEQALPAERLARSAADDIGARYDANTQRAIDASLFGAPSYVIDGELFWGQDRLDFVQRALAADRP